MNSKPFWQSTTIWVNAIGIAVIALQLALNMNVIDPKYQELALAVFNLLNRFRTSSTIEKVI